MSNIDVLLVDDHALVREALRDRLDREPSIRIVAVAENATEAITKVVEFQPRVVLMDIDMPGLICFDAARRMTAISPETSVIFLSAHLHDQYVDQALSVGAKGYITKTEPPATVIRAIYEVAAGRAFFSDEVRARLVVDSHGVRLAPKSKSRASTLTPRESEVVRYIARGLAKKEIARIMALSVKTVDKHSSNIMDKLDIHDRVELARFAIREGLSEP